MAFRDALETIVGSGMGTFLSCVTGSLAYFEGEEPGARSLLLEIPTGYPESLASGMKPHNAPRNSSLRAHSWKHSVPRGSSLERSGTRVRISGTSSPGFEPSSHSCTAV
jgi:hypothetical protein